MRAGAAKKKDAHVFERDPHDWYVEPERCTRQLAAVEEFDGPILDPTCGKGNIVKALRRLGLIAYGSDLVNRFGPTPPAWFLGSHDFLNLVAPIPSTPAADVRGGWGAIVFNPPYFRGLGAEKAIRRALLFAPKVCAFVNRRFTTGQSRATGLYVDFRPARIWEITPRPSCPPGSYLEAGGKAEGDTMDYCWIVWERPHASPTVTGWLTKSHMQESAGE